MFRKKETPVSPALGKGEKTDQNAARTTPLSKSEQDATKKLFVLLIQACPRLMSVFEINGGMSSDDLCRGMISISQATGTTFEMIRHYIADDFKRHASTDQGSIMRGNCIASKLTKEFLKRVGRDYLATLLNANITQILESDESFEIDPLKLEDICKTEESLASTIAANKAKLVEAVKAIVTTITSPEMMDKLPAEVRVLSSYFGEFANNYAPEQFYPLVGGFLMLRWINPAITNPDAYGIVPENIISPNVRRNFILMTKVVQNLSNGVEFSNKESYMMPVNEFIKANFWRMEKYLRGVVSPITAPKIIEPNIPDLDFLPVHKIFAEQAQQIMEQYDNLPANEKNDATRQSIQELLDTFGQYRHIDNFLKKKYVSEENVTIKFVVESGEQTFETSVDGSVLFLQPLIQKMTAKIRKHELLTKKSPKAKPTVETPQVFGRSLEDLMAQQSKYRIDIEIPQFIQEAVNILMLKGLDKDMLFVKPGNQAIVDNLRKEIDKGNRVTFTNVDENTIAQLIKLYLRELPESLFPEETHKQLLDLGGMVQLQDQQNTNSSQSNLKSSEMIIEKVKEFLKVLPKSHHSLLYTLCWLLFNIRKNCAVNLMTCPQLANVFGPIMHRYKPPQSPKEVSKPPRKPTMDSIGFPKTDTTQIHINKVVEALIKYFESVFEESIALAEENVKSGLPILRYRLITKSVQSISYVHPTGNLHGLAITAMGSRIQAWDLENGSVMRIFEDRTEDKGSVTFVKVESDSSGKCSGRLWVMKENTTYIYDVKSSEILYTIPRGGTSLTQYKHEMWINSIDTNFIYVYDVRNCKEIEKFAVQPNSVFQMGTFGDNVWAGSFNGGISVIGAKSRNLLNDNKTGHKRKINTFVGTDKFVLSGSDDGAIGVWNRDTFALEKRVEAHAGKIKQLSFFNNIVWCTTWDMTMKMYTANFELVSEVKEHTDSVTGLIFHWSQKQKKWIMWSGSYDGTLCVFSIPSIDPPPRQFL